MRPHRGLTIGKLAGLSRVNLETVRYYERIGIMPEPDRTEGGLGLYSEAHSRRLTFSGVAANSASGSKPFVRSWTWQSRDIVLCDEVQPIAAAHLEEVRAKLGGSRAVWRPSSPTPSAGALVMPPAPACPVLEMLEAA